jgi:hypothetical protein
MPPSESDMTEHDGKNNQADDGPTAKATHDRNANTSNGRGSGSGSGRGSGRGWGRGNTNGRGGRGRGRGGSSDSCNWREPGRGQGRGSPSSAASASGRVRGGRTPPKVKLVTSDFPSLHKKCGAAQYKVHRPGCSCSKVKQARSAVIVPTTMATTATSSGETDAGASSPSHPDPIMERLDGLIVIPDTNFIAWVYLCQNTSASEFQRDSFAAEKKLQSEMFPPSSSTTTTTGSSEETAVVPVSSFKVSCAACLLKHEPNGFVCVSSISRQTVDFARDLARTRANMKRNDEGNLHSDHAHYICSLSKRTLWNLLHSARTRQQTRISADLVLEQLLQQGVPAKVGENVKFGHHLDSFLKMPQSSSDTGTTSSSSSQHWLALVYDDTKERDPCWTIDLPGGKRHLAETTFQCAVRETEEEISLQIDETWLMILEEEEDPNKRRNNPHRSGDGCNAFYALTPPSEMLMENMTENKFWQPATPAAGGPLS